MHAIAVEPGTTRVAGRPELLFEFPMVMPTGGNRPYDVAPDGRFFIIRNGQDDAVGAPATNLIVVQNWFEELKRLVPTN